MLSKEMRGKPTQEHGKWAQPDHAGTARNIKECQSFHAPLERLPLVHFTIKIEDQVPKKRVLTTQEPFAIHEHPELSHLLRAKCELHY